MKDSFSRLMVSLALVSTAHGIEPDVAAMKKSVVKIVVTLEVRTTSGETGVATSKGTGYLTGGGKYVVTNNHVCCGGERPGMTVTGRKLVVYYSRTEFTPARVVWNSEKKDLGILELEQPLARPDITFARDADIKDGMGVWAVGFPGAAEQVTTTEESDFVSTATNGIIGKFVDQVLVRNGPIVPTISHSAATNAGNSGGPLYNFCGQVIATNFAKALATIRQRVQVRNPATGGVMEREVEQRVVMADGINWSLRLGNLLPELDRLGIRYGVATGPCQEIDKETKQELTHVSGEVSSISGRVSTLVVMQIGSVALALVAVGLTMNRRVRQTVSRRLSSRRTDDRAAIVGGPVFTAPRQYLKGVAGFYAGTAIPLEAEPWVLGRDRDASNLVFPADQGTISKRHCSISFDPSTGKVYLEDMWSSNGTFLASGVKLEPGRPFELRTGDRFYLADRGNLFEISAEG
ncbi:MAG: trypsin-like peptidase domain-containing protein [Bryobacterales bacterium]|nr:trypsin-like peptidase domain-containing protein [Bryobacterales bacterium]